jgi:putative holliday junction resolvase
MKLMGIDYGAKRVGIALSDVHQEYAFPKMVLANNKELLPKIKDICLMEEVKAIIVGDSKDYNMEPNKIMDKVVPFIEELRMYTRLPVELEDEFMTSAEAERLQGKNDMLDASAAALILKSYMDKKMGKKRT